MIGGKKVKESKLSKDLNDETVEDIFEVAGIKIEEGMDENLKKAIAKYNLVHEKIVTDLKTQ